MHRLPGTTLCILALLACVRSEASAQAGYEEGILEVVAERLAPMTVLMQVDPAGGVLVPVVQIANYLGLDPVRSDASVVLPRLGGGVATLHADRPLMIIGSDTVALTPAEVVATADEIYLRSERLEALLEAHLALDLSRLTLGISRETPFPVQQRMIAEQRRAVLLARQRLAQQRTRLDEVPYQPASGLGVLDWEIATSGLDPSQLTTVRAQSGVALGGGDLIASMMFDLGRDASRTVSDASFRYHRVFPRRTQITQAHAGAILSSGLFSRFIEGFELSNRPYLRGPELGEMLVQPDLPAGWDYEVFQGNVLLGYSNTGAGEPVSVPLRTGATPVQVRMYGPAGEEVVQTVLYQTPVSLVPLGRLEWAAGLGRCVGELCDRYAHADVRYGASSFLTFGGGLELAADSAADHLRPYAVASASSGERVTGEVSAMPGALYSAVMSLFPRDGSRAQLRGSVSRPGFGPISLVPDSLSRWDTEAAWYESLSIPRVPFRQVRIGLAASGAAGDLQRWRISTAGNFSRGYVETRYEREPTGISPHLLTTRLSISAPVQFRGRTWRPALTSSLAVGRHGLRFGELGGSVQPVPNAVVHAGVQWSRGQPRPALSLSLTARTGAFVATVRGVTSPRGGGSSAAVLSGSAALSPDGVLTHSPIARTGYAGLHGVVFLDSDGDGIFSPGELPIADADVLVGNNHVVADEQGRYRTWNLQPYDVVGVAIDSTRSADPSWTTTQPAFFVRPVPNTALRVDVPIIQTRELTGSITAGPRVPTVAGLTLRIERLDAEVDPVSTVTFSDGQFYVSRVRPGRYRLTVSDASLAALGAAMQQPAIEFTVPATGDDVLVELPPIHLIAR